MAGGASMMSCEDKLKLAEAALSAMETHVLPALATKDAEIARLKQCIHLVERLREALDGIAAPLHIDGDNHMAAVQHARAALAQTEEK